MNKKLLFLLIGCMLFGLWARWQFIHLVPAVNDEAFYMYDGFNINQGLIPIKDFFTKGVPFLYVLAGWQRLFGYQLMTSRVFLLILSFFLIPFILFLSKKNRQIGIYALALFFIDPYVALMSPLVKTNTPFVLSHLITIWLFINALRKRSIKGMVFTGFAFTISFFIRQVAIFMIPMFGILYINAIFKNPGKLKMYIKTGVILFTVTGLLIGFIFITTYAIAGKEKAYLALSISSPTQSKTALIKNGTNNVSIRGKIYKTSEQLIDLINRSPVALTGLGLAVIMLISSVIQKRYIRYLLYGGIFFSTLQLILEYQRFFLRNTLGLRYFPFEYKLIILLIVVVLFLSTWVVEIDRKHFITYVRKYQELFITSLSGIFFVWVVYFFYTKFEEVTEIFIFIYILMGLFVCFILSRKNYWISYLMIPLTIIILSQYAWNFNNTYIPTGSINLNELQNSVQIIKKGSRSGDTIFTGFPLFALEAGRRVPLDISHPSWYGYEHIETSYRNTVLPKIESLEKEIYTHPPAFAVIDRFTQESYIDRYRKIDDYIKNNYKPVKTYSTFTLLKRSSR